MAGFVPLISEQIIPSFGTTFGQIGFTERAKEIS